MKVEIDQSLRAWTISDPEIPVAVVDGKPVHKISFTYKTIAVINDHSRKNGGFAQVFVGVK